MHTWTIVAAKEAAITTGMGAGIVPTIAPASLDGFAVGALLTGACFLAITTPRRARRSRLRRLPGAGQEAFDVAAGESPPSGYGGGSSALTAQSPSPAVTFYESQASGQPAAETRWVPDSGEAPDLPARAPDSGAAPGLGAARGSGGALDFPAGVPDPGVLPDSPAGDPDPAAGPAAAGAAGRVRASYQSRHRRAEDATLATSGASRFTEPRRTEHRRTGAAGAEARSAAARHAAARHAAPAGSLGSRITRVFPVRPLSGVASN